MWIGKILIILASILVLCSGDNTLRLSMPGLSVLVACLLWGIDNNLTRELETLCRSNTGPLLPTIVSSRST